RPVAVGRQDLRPWRGCGERERLAARARAQVQHPLIVLGSTGERDQLAAFVLNLDQALSIRRMVIDPRIRRQPDSPRTVRRWRCIDKLIEKTLARGPRRVRAEIERRAFEQSRPFVLAYIGRKLRD